MLVQLFVGGAALCTVVLARAKRPPCRRKRVVLVMSWRMDGLLLARGITTRDQMTGAGVTV